MTFKKNILYKLSIHLVNYKNYKTTTLIISDLTTTTTLKM